MPGVRVLNIEGLDLERLAELLQKHGINPEPLLPNAQLVPFELDDHSYIIDHSDGKIICVLDSMEVISPEAIEQIIAKAEPIQIKRYRYENIDIPDIIERDFYVEPKPSKKVPRKRRHVSPNWNF